MASEDTGLPTIIVPYPGPAREAGVQDIVVYLRPETNGVLAESTILKIVRTANTDQEHMKLVFLANVPGEFIVSNHIVEQYYALKLHFAVMGRSVFTEIMKQRFTSWFGVPFDEADIIGSFRALEVLGKEPEELFNTWVSDSEVCVINGQSIKRLGSYYVVNYDIPALIHKNSKNTDIAVMVFRCSAPYERIRELVRAMHGALCGAGILDPQFDAARAFHFSKGPFEQILDGISYLSADHRLGLRLEDFTFAGWVMEKGLQAADICRVLLNPIVEVQKTDGTISEENLFQFSQNDSFEDSFHKFKSIIHRIEMIHHGPLLRSMWDGK